MNGASDYLTRTWAAGVRAARERRRARIARLDMRAIAARREAEARADPSGRTVRRMIAADVARVACAAGVRP